MDRRLQLQTLLESLGATEDDPTKILTAYFQPDENVSLEYPCVVYQRDSRVTEFASNAPYRGTQRYQVTLIDRDPDTDYLDKIALLPLCSYNRFFVADNLNHDVFTLYF